MKKINLKEIQINAKEAAADQLDDINGGCRIMIHFICNGRELNCTYQDSINCRCPRTSHVYMDHSNYKDYVGGNNNYGSYRNVDIDRSLPAASYYQKYGKWPR